MQDKSYSKLKGCPTRLANQRRCRVCKKVWLHNDFESLAEHRAHAASAIARQRRHDKVGSSTIGQAMKDTERAEAIKRDRALVLEDPQKREHFVKFRALSKPIIDELSGLGYHVESLGELRHQGKPWKSALPALLRWLPKIDNPDVKEEIVRCLSVPWLC